MTNKLPEVGKRYRYYKEPRNIVDVIGFWNNEYILGCKATNTVGRLHNLSSFDDDFEELPDSQEKPEVQLNESIVSEVEKAKENLKKAIKASHVDFPPYNPGRRYIELAVKKLIDALENAENPGVVAPIESKVNSEKRGDFSGNLARSKSIWKPVSELPKFIKEMGYPNLIIKFQDGNTKYGSFQNTFFADMRGHAFKQKFVKKWCYLTDFINDIEQTKLDHEERIRKLEGR